MEARFSRNNIENASGWGISSSGIVTVTYNRVVGGANGVSLSGGVMRGNLVANNSGIGLQVNGNSTVISNTFTGNAGNTIKLVSATSLLINGNNLEGNRGTYDIENLIPKTTLMMVQAMYNWWGTTSNATIDQRIFDYNDDFNLGQVLYAPKATAPIQTAPAYVRSVTTDPPSPVGIQTVKFDVLFSRLMERGLPPSIFFRNLLNDTWAVYNTANSGLPANGVGGITIDTDSSLWFGTSNGAGHFDGTNWTVYNTSNSGIPSNSVNAIAVGANGSHWFGTYNGAAHFDGTNWTLYNTSNSGLPSNALLAVAAGADGSLWFGGYFDGVAHFDGSIGLCTMHPIPVFL